MSGVRWRRVDFHLHSPAASSFICPSGFQSAKHADQQKFAERYVSRLVDAGIEIASLTDYNGVSETWYSILKSEAERRGVLLLPGTELSVSEGRGLHILVVFPVGTQPRAINECLRGLDKSPGRSLLNEREHHDIDLRDHLQHALHSLRERFDCLLIPAHANNDKGLIKAVGAQRAADLIQDVGMDALEHSGNVKEVLLSTGRLSATQLESLAFVEFTDPKRVEEIGAKVQSDGSSRGTWLKLSATDLPAIRLALHDPQMRVRLEEPRAPAHPRLISMHVTGSGFLGNLSLDWNSDLNTLVGGRGVGKSAVLETIRYALDLAPYSDSEYRRRAVQHAVGSGGSVILSVERPGEGGGKLYSIRRVLDENSEVIDPSTDERLGVAPRELFGPGAEPIVLLQREIHEVSRDESFRLTLLDVLVGEEAANAAKEVEKITRGMEENATKLRAAQRRVETKQDLEDRGRSLQKEIDFYDSQGISSKLDEHAKIERDDVALNESLALLAGEAAGTWKTNLATLREKVSSADQRLADSESIHRGSFAEARTALKTFASTLHETQNRLTEAVSEAEGAVQSAMSAWNSATHSLREELRDLKQLDSALSPERYLNLIRERAQVETELSSAHDAEREVHGLEAERDQLLGKLGERRLEANKLRRQVADDVNSRLKGKLRVTVEYKGQKKAWQDQLEAFFKGSRLTSDAVQKIAEFEGSDGVHLCSCYLAGPDELVTMFNISHANAERVCAWLSGENLERLHRLQSMAPNDAMVIELMIDGVPRPLDRLSMGQQATAILLLLFAMEGRILILDQPEDDLDNRFVFEDVVSLLRSQKGRRQVIAATHNPNIPVLGDAEQVLVLAAEDDHATVLTRASIDDAQVRQHLRTVLEGGEEAFRRRAEKYGGVGQTH
jgi:chromosome segregation protein